MSPMMLSLLDAVVIVTLLYAIYYMRIVAKSMRVIRDGKSEMQQILKEMTQSIAKAEETVQGMKRLADDKGRNLQRQMDDAQQLAEELKFINQTANTMAQRLEKNTTLAAAAHPATAPKPTAAAASMSKAEKDLADAIAKRKSEAG